MRQECPRSESDALQAVRVCRNALRGAQAALRAIRKKGKKRVSRGLGPALSNYRRDRDECDKLMARIIKVEIGHCQACGTERRWVLQWAHGLSRKYTAVRWDWTNGFVLCSGCHVKYTHDPIGWREWMVAKMGIDAYDALVRRSRFKVRHNPLLVVGLRARAGELGVLTDDGWKLWQEGR